MLPTDFVLDDNEPAFKHYRCLNCGEIYYSTVPLITCYCSPECEKQARRKHDYVGPDCIVSRPYDLNGLIGRKCLVCGDPFVARSTDRLFCNKVCANKYANANKVGHHHTCLHCEKEFWTWLPGDEVKYCSMDCQIKAEKARRKAKTQQLLAERIAKDGPKICKACGKEFVVKSVYHYNTQIFCPDCSKISKSIRNRMVNERNSNVAAAVCDGSAAESGD